MAHFIAVEDSDGERYINVDRVSDILLISEEKHCVRYLFSEHDYVDSKDYPTKAAATEAMHGFVAEANAQVRT